LSEPQPPHAFLPGSSQRTPSSPSQTRRPHCPQVAPGTPLRSPHPPHAFFSGVHRTASSPSQTMAPHSVQRAPTTDGNVEQPPQAFPRLLHSTVSVPEQRYWPPHSPHDAPGANGRGPQPPQAFLPRSLQSNSVPEQAYLPQAPQVSPGLPVNSAHPPQTLVLVLQLTLFLLSESHCQVPLQTQATPVFCASVSQPPHSLTPGSLQAIRPPSH